MYLHANSTIGVPHARLQVSQSHLNHQRGRRHPPRAPGVQLVEEVVEAVEAPQRKQVWTREVVVEVLRAWKGEGEGG